MKFTLPKEVQTRAGQMAYEAGYMRVVNAMDSLARNKDWEVTIEVKKAGRTPSQNRMLWALYTDILRVGGEAMAGWTKEDLHTFFLQNHFGHETIEMFGVKRNVPLNRSSKLSKTEFQAYVDSILQFMAERGVSLSMPGDM